jgi:hypothetical protein
MTDRTPTGSTATGFSMNTFLPACTMALRWIGRNPGGAAVMIRLTPGTEQTPW